MSFGFTGCHKPQQEFLSDGVITGQDFRKCACCGGYFITIDKQDYMFWDVPATSNFTPGDGPFPMAVKLDWKKVDNACPANRIEVIRIKPR
jgi:hypothetical protein